MSIPDRKLLLGIKRKSLCGNFDFKNFIGNLKEISLFSYKKFLQKDIPYNERQQTGIHRILSIFFPIHHVKSKMKIEYISYDISEPRTSTEDCVIRGINYAGSMKINLRITNLVNNEIKDLSCSLGEIPLMTEDGTFIINGHERIFVSQIQKCPGVIFTKEVEPTLNRKISVAKIHPVVGSWVYIKIEREMININIDKKKKFGITTFFLCFPKDYHFQTYDIGYDISEILDLFYEKTKLKIEDNWIYLTFDKNKHLKHRLHHDIYIKDVLIAKKDEMLTEEVVAKITTKQVRVPIAQINNFFLAKDIYDENTGEIFCHIGSKIEANKLDEIQKYGDISVFVVDDDHTAYILNTLNHEKIFTKDEALESWATSIKLGSHYGPLGLLKIFATRFSDPKYYDLYDVGRKRLNQVLNLNIQENLVSFIDFIETTKQLVLLSDNLRIEDEIDSLVNKRFIGVGDIITNYFRMGVIKFEKNVRDRIYNIMGSGTNEENQEVEKKITADIFNMRICLYPVMDGFYRSSQMLDNTNILAKRAQLLKVVASGTTGGDKRFSEEQREFEGSKFAKMCPIQTPEGKKVGIVEHLTAFCRIDKDGFITAPYYVVKDGVVTTTVRYLSPNEELNKIIASLLDYVETTNANGEKIYRPKYDYLNGKQNNDYGFFHNSQIDFVNVCENQVLSISSTAVPFPGNNDGYRVLSAANMNAQALMLLESEAPFVSTGMDEIIGDQIVAKNRGTVSYVDCKRIVIELEDSGLVDIYYLSVNKRTNNDTCITHKPLVNIGDFIEKDVIIADGFTTKNAEFSPGRNLNMAYMSHPYGYEDSFLLSDRLVFHDTLSSIHIQSYLCNVYETRNGPEKNTRDIPKVHDDFVRHLDESGIINIGTYVKGGDILVGKVTSSVSDLSVSSEYKLLNIIFGEKIAEFSDSSLRLPYGFEGTVIKVKILTRKGVPKDGRAILQDKLELDEIEKIYDEKINIMRSFLYKKVFHLIPKDKTITLDGIMNLSKETIIQKYSLKSHNAQEIIKLFDFFEKNLKELNTEKTKKVSVLKYGYDLPDGVLKIIVVDIATKKVIEPGDKLAGRYGNKGIISAIVPAADMPHLADGTPVDMVINTLGLLSRMNLGQILETTIGYAILSMQKELKRLLIEYYNNKQDNTIDCMKDCLKKIIDTNTDLRAIANVDNIESLDEKYVIDLVKYFYKNGIRVQIAQFHNLPKEDLNQMLIDFFANSTGKVDLYDGKTGEKFEGQVLVGYQLIMKLCHLVSFKMHARSIGPYLLSNSQPVKGKAKFGGQKCGEMEAWALEAFGVAAHIREMFSDKSDDMYRRNDLFSHLINVKKYSIIVMNPAKSRFISESFRLLIYELRAACFDLSLIEMPEVV